jgi:hypothetical protein
VWAGAGAEAFVAQGVEAGGGKRLLLAPNALYLADPSVGIQLCQGEEPIAGLFDALFDSQPVELGVLVCCWREVITRVRLMR